MFVHLSVSSAHFSPSACSHVFTHKPAAFLSLSGLSHLRLDSCVMKLPLGGNNITPVILSISMFAVLYRTPWTNICSVVAKAAKHKRECSLCACEVHLWSGSSSSKTLSSRTGWTTDGRIICIYANCVCTLHIMHLNHVSRTDNIHRP